jgi:PAS domain S-box-containing protein
MSEESPDRKWNGDNMRAVADRLHTPVAVLEEDGTPLYVNDATAFAMKQAPERLIGRRILELVHPDDRPRVDRELRPRRLRSPPGAGR